VAVDPTELTRARRRSTEIPPGTDGAGSQPVAPAPGPKTVTHRDLRGRRQQFEARKVRRLIRHLDAWSVLKLALVFFLSLWLVLIIASVIVWSVARGSGTVDKIESFVDSNFSTDWKFNGDFLLRQVGLVGLVLTMAATLFTTIGAVMFNLISDIIGGVWITVIEEETARPVSGSPPE
jgi:Transmembrane domain of unknown function (DUF3566)